MVDDGGVVGRGARRGGAGGGCCLVFGDEVSLAVVLRDRLVLGVALLRLLLRGDRLVCLATAGAQGQRQQECQQQRRASMSSLFHIGSSFLFFPMGRDRNIPPYKLSVRWDVLER